MITKRKLNEHLMNIDKKLACRR